MKAKSTQRPTTILDLGNGRYHFNYNVVEVTDREYTSDTEYTESTEYEYDYIEVGSRDKNDILVALIRLRYSQDDEIALINKSIASLHSDEPIMTMSNEEREYDKYRAYVTECKTVITVLSGDTTTPQPEPEPPVNTDPIPEL